MPRSVRSRSWRSTRLVSITGSGDNMSRPRSRPIFARRRPSRTRRLVGWLPLGLLVVSTATIAAVRSVDDSKPAEAGPVHVHALGVDPGDGSLFIATHTGLFRLPLDQESPERVSDLHQDTMGFTVAGPGHFLGSGHPDLRDDLPPLLGLNVDHPQRVEAALKCVRAGGESNKGKRATRLPSRRCHFADISPRLNVASFRRSR